MGRTAHLWVSGRRCRRDHRSAAALATRNPIRTNAPRGNGGVHGVCVATSGPGAIHLLNGLYDAKLDHQPVVALVGQSSRHALGGSYQQEVDLPSLFKDVASEYVQTCVHPAQLRHLIDRAMRIAKSERTVTCIVFPKDVQELDAIDTPKRAHDTIHSSAPYSTPRVLPKDADLDRAAEILNAGKRVAMLVGAGALGAGQEVLAVADALGAGVAKALLGRCVVPDTIPFVTGSIGLLGTQPSSEMMSHCDTLLMVGSSFPYSEFLPQEGQARGIQIDLDGRMLGLRYPMELNLQGDSKETLRALLPRLARKTDRSWQQRIEANVRDWWDLLDERAHVRAHPIESTRHGIERFAPIVRSSSTRCAIPMFRPFRPTSRFSRRRLLPKPCSRVIPIARGSSVKHCGMHSPVSRRGLEPAMSRSTIATTCGLTTYPHHNRLRLVLVPLGECSAA